MRRVSIALLIILSILSGLLTVGGTATSLPVMTTINPSKSYTYYHIFDEKDARIPVLLDASLTLSNNTRTELVRDEGKVRIWNGTPSIRFSYNGKVLNSKPSIYGHQIASITVSYADETQKKQVGFSIPRDTGTLIGNMWAFYKPTYVTQLETERRTVKASPSLGLIEDVLQEDRVRFIGVMHTKSTVVFNEAYHASHAERIGQCVIEIVMNGYWSDDAKFKQTLNAVVEHARNIARTAEIRAADCHLLFPPVAAPTQGTTTTSTGKPTTSQTEQPQKKKWSEVSGRLLFNLKDSQSASVNQRLILGVYDQSGTLVGTTDTRTDQAGRFTFLTEIEEGDLLKLSAPLSYHSVTGEMVFGVYDDRKNREIPTVIECGGGEIRVKADTNLNDVQISLMEGRLLNQQQSETDARNAVSFYSMMADGIQYYRDVLNVNLEYKLPMRLILFSQARAAHPNALAFYNPADGDIYIYPDSSDIYLGNYPSILFHELAHGVMYDIYNMQFPSGGTADLSHGGYANESSADSFLEGFADFMAAVVSSENQDSRDRAVLEPDWVAWHNNGLSEEYAIAGVLLDLWDSSTTDDDKVSLGMPKVWDLLKDYCPDFKSFYIRLQAAYVKTSQMAEIDKIFIAHGIYEVKDKLPEGSGSYQPGEAFRDANFNQTYDPGEVFIDFNSKNGGVMEMVFKSGYLPGWAAYPDNPTRNYSPVIPWHSIKTSETHKYFEAKIVFPNHPELNYIIRPDNFNGNIYIPIPPASYGAVITVSKLGADVGKQQPLTFKAVDFYKDSAKAMENGYYLVHDFKVKSNVAFIGFIVVIILAVAAYVIFRFRKVILNNHKKVQ